MITEQVQELTAEQVAQINNGQPENQLAGLGSAILALQQQQNAVLPFDVTVQLTSAAASTAVAIVPDASVPAGLKVHVKGISIQVDGATAWTDSTGTEVLIEDDSDSPVVFGTIAKAGLTGDAVLEVGDSGIALGAAFLADSGSTEGYGIVVVADHTFADGSTLNVRVWGEIR